MSYLSKRLDERVEEILCDGGVGFMPSDTIYGLSCVALDEHAVERIYRLKQRDSDKPLIVLIANISQLQQLDINKAQAVAVEQYWPGGLTLICLAPNTPEWLQRGTKSLAVRIPDNNELRELISKTGPLVSTSANTQGADVAYSVIDAKRYFGDELDFYVDTGDLSNRQPSTLVRAVSGKLEVIRPGAVKIEGEEA